jgi:hypothetical protein
MYFIFEIKHLKKYEMVGNMSFYKCPNFGAVMIRFSIFFLIKRKTNFFSALKMVSIF